MFLPIPFLGLLTVHGGFSLIIPLFLELVSCLNQNSLQSSSWLEKVESQDYEHINPNCDPCVQRGIRSCISSCRKVCEVIISSLQTELVPTLTQSFWMDETNSVLHSGLSDPVYKMIVSLPVYKYFFSSFLL